MQNPAYNNQYPPQQPYQQGGYPNQGNYAPPQYPPQYNNQMPYAQPFVVALPSGYMKMANMPSIFIKQKFETWEALSGCQFPNVYNVYPADANGLFDKNQSPIFKAKEKSPCLQRICLPGDARAFEMKIYEIDPYTGKQIETMKFNRQYKCTCFCLGRPEMKVYSQQGEGSIYLGKIFHPYQCSTIGVDIYGQDDLPQYSITGSCTQLGIICSGFPCTACQEVQMEVVDFQTKQKLSDFLKQSAGCCKACVSDASNFSLVFPNTATPQDKALLMAAALFVDYRYFEQNPQDANQGGSKYVN